MSFQELSRIEKNLQKNDYGNYIFLLFHADKIISNKNYL